MLLSNGLHHSENLPVKFGFSLKSTSTNIAKKLLLQRCSKPLFSAFFNFSHKRPTFAFTSKSGYTLTFANRIAHSGSQGETRGGFPARDIGRVDRVNSLGTLCIVTFGTAQFDKPFSVAAAHHGGNTDFA